MSLINVLTQASNALLYAFTLAGREIKRINQLHGNATTQQGLLDSLTGAANAAPGQVLSLSGGHAVLRQPPGFIGEIRSFIGETPKGWLPCEAQLLSVADYPELFAKLGNHFGGDGVSTFGVPSKHTLSLIQTHIYVSHEVADVIPVQIQVLTAFNKPVSGIYPVDSVLDFTLQLLGVSAVVTGGPALLVLDIGGTAVSLTPLTVTGSALTYQYTVQAGHTGAVTAALDQPFKLGIKSQLNTV